MGQPWPAAREHVGSYFGKNGEQLDEYGHNLAAARLPGAGFSILHNDAIHLTRSIMREAGLVSDSEAWDMFHMERSLRLTSINIPLQSIESAGTKAVDRMGGNAWCQTSSSTTIQALIVLDELAETVVLPLPSSR